MITTTQTSGKLLVSLLPMIKIKPEAMDSAIATIEVMDCAMVMNARHSLAQLNDSRDTGVHYGVFTNEQNLNTYEAPQADTGKVFSCFTKGDNGVMPSSPGENYHRHDKSDDDKSLQSDSCFDSDTDYSDSDSEVSDADGMEICQPPLGYEGKDIYKDLEESIIYGSTQGASVSSATFR